MRSEIWKIMGLILSLLLVVLTPVFVDAGGNYSFEESFNGLTEQVSDIFNEVTGTTRSGAIFVLNEAVVLKDEAISGTSSALSFNFKDILSVLGGTISSTLSLLLERDHQSDSPKNYGIPENPNPVGFENKSIVEADVNISQFASAYSDFLDGLIVRNIIEEELAPTPAPTPAPTSEEVGVSTVSVVEDKEIQNYNSVLDISGKISAVANAITSTIGNFMASVYHTLSTVSETAPTPAPMPEEVEEEVLEEYSWQVISVGSCSGQFRSPGVFEGEKCGESMSEARINTWDTESCPRLWEWKEVVCK